MMSIEELEQNRKELILLRSIRGSHMFKLDTETSDLDTYQVFCCPPEWLLGTRDPHTSGCQYVGQLKTKEEIEAKLRGESIKVPNDHAYNELDKFINELKNSGHDALCPLFTPPELILYKSPLLDPLFENRDKLLTKRVYNAFLGLATSQLAKATGKSKAMNIDPKEVQTLKSPIEFCILGRSGSCGDMTLKTWLHENGLKQEHCGLVKLGRGEQMYTLFYDWFADKDLKVEDYIRLRYHIWNPRPSVLRAMKEELDLGKKTEMIKYRGVVIPDSTQLRLSAVSKEDAVESLCTFQFSLTAYQSHFRDYNVYWDWVKHRNPVRYEENKGQGYDAKNCSHCLRALRMAKEVLDGRGLILDRQAAGDRDLLLAIKTHKYDFDTVNEMLLKAKQELKEAYEKSTLPDEPDAQFLENFLLEVRKKFYKI